MSIYLNQPENGKEGRGFMIKIDHNGNYYEVVCKPVHYGQDLISHFSGACVYFERRRLNKKTLAKYAEIVEKHKTSLESLTNADEIAQTAVTILKRSFSLKGV